MMLLKKIRIKCVSFFHFSLIKIFHHGIRISVARLPRIIGPVEIRGRSGLMEIGKYVSLNTPRIIFDKNGTGKIVMGDHVNIETRVILSPRNGSIKIGDRVFIGHHSLLQSHDNAQIVIGQDTLIANDVKIFASNHETGSPENGYRVEKGASVKIGNNVWIGSSAILLPGRTIGDFSVIGAGTLITKSVPPYSLCVGNPGKIIKKYDQNSKKWIRM